MNFEKSFLEQEIRRTNPDYVIYIPSSDDRLKDQGNEHLHVFRAKDGRLCALWTMSSFEGTFTHRPVISFSRDDGLTWSSPRNLLRDTINAETGENMGSWAAPAISKSGKIYVIYNKHIGKRSSKQRGRMVILASDDCGDTWTPESVRDLPRSALDAEDTEIPVDWVIWQTALRLSSGEVIFGYTRGWMHSRYDQSPDGVWVNHPCSCEFMQLDNIDEDPDPADLKISYFSDPNQPLAAPLRFHPELFCGEEPAICELPDGRLFCVMRTAEGHIWYSVSCDHARTWRKAEMLRFFDDGPGIEHPLSPCPIYRISAAEYVLFAHCHDGFGTAEIPQINVNWRNPIFMLKGKFRPGAHQPIWFSDPVKWMDNGEVSLRRKDLAMYADLTLEKGVPVFWYPDRKFFLLGKRIEL